MRRLKVTVDDPLSVQLINVAGEALKCFKVVFKLLSLIKQSAFTPK